LDQPFHVVAAVVAEHDGVGHAVVEDRAGIVGVGALAVLAARLLGRHPHVEDRGPRQDLVGKRRDRVAVAERGGQRHRRAVAPAPPLTPPRPPGVSGPPAFSPPTTPAPSPPSPPASSLCRAAGSAPSAGFAPTFTRARSKRSNSHSAAAAGAARLRRVRSSKS